MRLSLGILILVAAFAAEMSACRQATPASTSSPAPESDQTQPAKELTVEEIVREAHTRYDAARQEGKTAEQAVQATVEFLKAQSKVKETQVTGSDTVRVTFTTGQQLLLMLGRERM